MTDATFVRDSRRFPSNRSRTAALAMVIALSLVACTASDGGSTSTTAQDNPSTTPEPTTEPSPSTSMATSSTATPGDSSSDNEVVMRQTSFDPVEIVVPVGSTVTWTNDDTISHTTTANDGTWDSDTMSPGDTFEYTFDTAGDYEFFCSIHPSSMRGTIRVEN